MKATSATKIIGFPPSAGPCQVVACTLCGSDQRGEGVCQKCAFRLIDMALSTAVDHFLKLVEEPPAEPRSQPSMLPFKYGHYEICLTQSGNPWELGRGSMGITYKATDNNLGNIVALKIINGVQFGSALSRDRFSREAKSTAQLSHENIARVFHLGQEGENCFYAMEFIEGETLEARIRREGALPCKVALSVVLQAARALRVAHGKNFIHRDIKPTNIMLARSEHSSENDVAVKVIDFGLVKAVADGDPLDDFTCLSYFAGTPYYASPEQLDSGTVDARSDIFSLGMCLWYMLAGTPPGLSSTLVAGRRRPPIPDASDRSLNRVSGPILALLRSMTACDPALRPQSANELVEKTQECLAMIDFGPAPGPLPAEREISQKAEPRLWHRPFVLSCLVLTSAVALAIPFTRRNSDAALSKQNTSEHSTEYVEAHALYGQGEEYRAKLTKADNQKAIKLYSKALATLPDFSDAYAALAISYTQEVARFGAPASKFDLAIESAQRAIALNPRAPKGFHALGAIRTYQGKPWEALTQLHHALELDPRFVPAMRDFSLLWCYVGQPQKALAWAKGAADAEPSNLHGWDAVAEASIDLCADTQARECYRRCLEISPGWMVAHCGLIHLSVLRGDFAAARQDYAVAESIEPSSVLPLTLKAQIDLFSGDYAQAEATYQRLLAMNRTGAVSYYGGISYLTGLAFLRSRVGDLAAANLLLEEAAKMDIMDSDGPQPIYDLAAVRSIQGRGEDALALLQQAIVSGWKDYRVMLLDPRFEPLRGDLQFQRMVEELRDHVALMRKESEQLCSRPLMIADYPVSGR